LQSDIITILYHFQLRMLHLLYNVINEEEYEEVSEISSHNENYNEYVPQELINGGQSTSMCSACNERSTIQEVIYTHKVLQTKNTEGVSAQKSIIC